MSLEEFASGTPEQLEEAGRRAATGLTFKPLVVPTGPIAPRFLRKLLRLDRGLLRDPDIPSVIPPT